MATTTLFVFAGLIRCETHGALSVIARPKAFEYTRMRLSGQSRGKPFVYISLISSPFPWIAWYSIAKSIDASSKQALNRQVSSGPGDMTDTNMLPSQATAKSTYKQK